jgi:hypothetical protein
MRLRFQIDVKKEYMIDYPTKDSPEDFQDFMKGFLEWQCDLVVKRIDEVIKRRLYNWHPLSPSYLDWKKKTHLDPRTWIATGQTLNSIHYWYSGLADAFFVGVHPTKRYRYPDKNGQLTTKKGAKILDILRWLEFGTTKMKARPLFSKVFKEFMSKSVQSKLYAEYIKSLKGNTIKKAVPTSHKRTL